MKHYYPNLNTLRFIAASFVIISHLELYKSFFKFNNVFYKFPIFDIMGKLGVVLFFVLSGFLITSLLLKERDKKGFINIKNFYIRRILRIWPLYYLIVLLGFYVFPHISVLDFVKLDMYADVIASRSPNIYYYLTIFANLGWAIYKSVPYVSQSWSIATEEQFYLFWPILIIIFKRRFFLSMFLVIIFYWSVKYFIDISSLSKEILTPRRIEIASRFWYSFNINCMAIGGIFAYIFHHKTKFSKIILNRKIFIFVTIFTIVILVLGVNIGFFHYDLYAVLFAIIICNLAINDSYKNTLENPITNHLGSISYGLYMFHWPLLTISLKIGNYFGSHYILPYFLTFGLTILVSHFSYKYFESYFLKLKSKF